MAANPWPRRYQKVSKENKKYPQFFLTCAANVVAVISQR